jgi:hypothetical protein
MPIRTKIKKPAFVLCHETREGHIWEIKDARLVAAMGARRKIFCPEAKIQSIILRIRKNKARRKRKDSRLETAAAKGA